VQSNFDRELLQRYYQVADERLFVVPNGVDLAEFSLSLRTLRPQLPAEFGVAGETPLILFAGMDFRRKGLETLLRAIPLLSHPSAVVLVAGQGPIARYRSLANALHIEHRVRFLGQVPNMARLYVAADLLALPTRYDPFASVVLEALACGTPVVTSRCGGGATAIEEPFTGAVVHDPLDHRELAAALNQQLAITTDRTAACAARAGQFTAESFARQTLAVLESSPLRRAA
jgi:UDP-glucose:(heptosyl)LPS alpha-1,3-glucosyltransferase